MQDVIECTIKRACLEENELCHLWSCFKKVSKDQYFTLTLLNFVCPVYIWWRLRTMMLKIHMGIVLINWIANTNIFPYLLVFILTNNLIPKHLTCSAIQSWLQHMHLNRWRNLRFPRITSPPKTTPVVLLDPQVSESLANTTENTNNKKFSIARWWMCWGSQLGGRIALCCFKWEIFNHFTSQLTWIFAYLLQFYYFIMVHCFINLSFSDKGIGRWAQSKMQRESVWDCPILSFHVPDSQSFEPHRIRYCSYRLAVI